MQTSSLLDNITLTATKQISSGRKPSATSQQQKQTITPCIAAEIGAPENTLHVHSSFLLKQLRSQNNYNKKKGLFYNALDLTKH